MQDEPCIATASTDEHINRHQLFYLTLAPYEEDVHNSLFTQDENISTLWNDCHQKLGHWR